jgi:trimeric autotransporter adhesin
MQQLVYPVANAVSRPVSYPVTGRLGLSPALPLDNLTSAAAYATRRLRTAYAGPLVRVRRSSDNAEADIGYGADGWLDEASLLAHVGAGDGFVTTWYDQSGNGRDATQTTAGHQPNIVNAGVVLPALDFDGVDDDMRSTVGAIGSNCEIMVATNDGVYFQAGVRFTDSASQLRLPHSGNLRSYVVLDTSFTAEEKAQIATYFSFASYTDAQWILSTRTVTNPTLRIDTTGSVTWNAVWSGGSATSLATGAESTLTMAGYRGLIVITTTGGAAITGSYSATNLWANTLSDLPSALTVYSHGGSNTVSGTLADLPSGLTYYNHSGSNTVSGSLAGVPAGLTFYAQFGSNTVSGSLADLPSALTYYGHTGNNTVSGALADLPSGVTFYAHTGSNTVSGALADLPSGLTVYAHTGNNTVSGSLADLPSALTVYSHGGSNTVTFSGATWHRTTMDTVRFGNNKNSATVDAVFNALAATVTSWTGSRVVDLQETGNAAPTSASATARTTIAGLGATVLVN